MLLELTCVFVILFALIFFDQNKRHGRSPPGPWLIPVISNLFDLVRDGSPHLTFCKLARKYGPIFTYKMGNQQVFVISEYEMLKQLLSKDVVTGRPKNPVFLTYSKNFGVALSDGPNWDIQRRFLIKTLKPLGFGKALHLERHVMDELGGLATLFGRDLNIPIAGNGLFLHFLTATMWGLMVSNGDADEKKEVAELVEAFTSSFNAACSSGLLLFPALRFISPGFFGWAALEQNIAKLKEFVTKRINKNKANLDPSNPTGFIDYFLIKMESTVDETSTFYEDSGCTYNNLVVLVSDMFIASIDTTGLTLEWALIYLSQQRSVQRRLQKEIDDVIGNSRTPSLSDRQMMPYAEAVILETLRISNVTALGNPHRLLESIEFQGYSLEKNSLIIPNLYSILHEPTLWGDDAEEFNPERFLSEDKSKVVRRDAFIPFSTGKRKCLGESVAMDTLYLFMIYIFQNFNIDPDPDCPVADLNCVPGLLLKPKPFRIVVRERRDD